MNYTSLSLSQTPPLSVPLPYFIAAPVFAVAAALLLLGFGPELLATRWSPAMLALTHLLTVGFLGTTMFGALQQLVPVLIGVPLPAQRAVAYLLFLLWLAGAVLLISGMALGMPAAVRAGALLLALAVISLVSLVARSLWRSSSQHASVRSMALAVAALVVAVSLVLYLILRFDGYLPLAHPLTTLHVGWASLGWIFLLLVGVAYQVVPMFQITPEYPRRMRRWLALLLWEGLILWSLQLSFPELAHVAWLLAAGVVLFAVQTLLLQWRRRRKLADVTLDYWRLAMVCLIGSAMAWAVDELWPTVHTQLLTGLLFLVGFAVSAVNGMLYKIVPFLVWLQLNNRLQQAGQRQGRVPNMKQVIPERHARWQLRLHGLGLLLLVVALLIPGWPVQAGAGVFLLSNLLLGWNLVAALRLYRRILLEQGVGVLRTA